jgi:mono/diheme cytochrome c family protein
MGKQEIKVHSVQAVRSKRFQLLFLLPFLIPAGARAWQGPGAEKTPATRSPALQPSSASEAVVKQYCIGCHNNRLKTADLSLQDADLKKVPANADIWEKVLIKLASKEMPPAGMPRPSEATLKQFTGYLEGELDRAAAADPNPGHPTIHRLNRNEYSNAVRDLLALDVKPGDTLPLDDTGYGFDNIGDVLSLSPVLVERYMSVGRTVARLAVGDTDVKPVIDVFTPAKEVRPKGAAKTGPTERVGDLPFNSAGGLSFQYIFPVDAEYDFKIRVPGSSAGFGEAAAPVAEVLDLRIPVKAGAHNVGLTAIRSTTVAEILPVAGRGFGGGGRGGPPETAHLDLRFDGARLKLYDVPENPTGSSFLDLAISGPFKVTGPGDSPSRQRIFVCQPASLKEEDACAQKIFATLARRAFRRPVVAADLNRLLPIYRAGRADGGFNAGIEMALRAVLVSPDFLFRVEHDPSGATPGAVHRINDFELASRLSFFLWSSIPDDRLLELAEQGKLKEPTVLQQEVARMLDDPKSKAFVSNFAGQYLYTRSLATEKPDPDEFPAFDPGLQAAFAQQTELFFRSMMQENRPITELLNANYTFVNQRLAEFYKMPGVYGQQFRRVDVTDPNRRGILGQGSILTVTSYPNRTSVVQRGKWVLDNLLGSPPPPPPPNVPSLDPHGKDGKLSMRQAMESHRANPVCAGCHSRMDPIGFALENFDGIGAWRDKDNGAKIDASGTLPGGATFTGPAGLAQLILEQHCGEFTSTFTEKLMTYALGRGVEFYDRPAMRSIIRDAAKQDTTIPALIEAIVKSPQFQMRRTPEK